MASRNGSSNIPNTVRPYQRVRIVRDLLRQPQYQLAQLEAIQRVEELDDDAPIPNRAPGIEETFGKERAKLEAQVERIAKQYRDEMPKVQALIDREDKQAEEEDERIDRLTPEQRAADKAAERFGANAPGHLK